MLDSQLDDSLEALGDGQRRLGGTALTDVRASTRRGVTGSARAKDRKDRATYQTVLDPRTRLVRAVCVLFGACFGAPGTSERVRGCHAPCFKSLVICSADCQILLGLSVKAARGRQ